MKSVETRINKKTNININNNTNNNSNPGILNNISTAFSKMMNDTEGFYLNYVEDNDK